MNYHFQGVLDQPNFATCTATSFMNSLSNNNLGNPSDPCTTSNLHGFFPNCPPAVVPNRSISQAATCYAKPSPPKVEAPPAPPKKPLTPYMIYMKETRPDVAKQNPNLRVTDVVKRVAEMWQSLEPDQKQSYVDRFKIDLEKFNKINEAYNNSLTKEQKQQIRQLKTDRKEKLSKRRMTTQLRELEKPKGPRSAFSLFLISRLPNRGDIPITEYTKEASEAWKTLPDETKQIFFANAREDKLRHEREMSNWRTRMEREGHHNVIKAVFKEDKPALERKRGGGRKTKVYEEGDEGREYLTILKYPQPGTTDVSNYK